MPAAHPKGYTGAQIALHWIIAALVLVQILFGEEIVPAFRAFLRGASPADDAMTMANLHVYVGIAILLLAVVRVALRVRYGAPAAPENESAIQQMIAKLAHLVLYAAIFLMPITGAIAWFFGIEEIGEIHELGKPVIIVVVGLHAAAALWQHFVVKSDVLRRMIRPAAR